MDRKSIGNYYEDYAVNYLKSCKYKILTRNYKTKFGEIDIVAYDKKSKVIVFVEVRYRKDVSYGMPTETVNFHKQKRILISAIEYIKKNKIDKDISYRFDVISIVGNSDNVQLDHIKGAFQLENTKFTI